MERELYKEVVAEAVYQVMLFHLLHNVAGRLNILLFHILLQILRRDDRGIQDGGILGEDQLQIMKFQRAEEMCIRDRVRVPWMLHLNRSLVI